MVVIIKSSKQCNIYIYKYMYIYTYTYAYLPVKVNERMFLKQSIFYDVDNSTPLVGLEPTISWLHNKLYW